MHKPKRSVSALLTLLLIISLESCGGMPERPQGWICINDFPRSQAICDDLNDPIKSKVVPLTQTDKWIMIDPDTWQNLNVYIEELKHKAEKSGCITSEERKSMPSLKDLVP